MHDSERLRWLREYSAMSEASLRERLAEVESAIRGKVGDPERFHFERALIRQLLGENDESDSTVA